MTNILKVSAILVFIGFSFHVFAKKANPSNFLSPDGYRWQQCQRQSLNCAYLVPDNWSLSFTEKDAQFKAQISSSSEHLPGIIDFGVITDAKKYTGFDAEKNIKLIIKNIDRQQHVKMDEWHKYKAPFKSYAVLAVDYKKGWVNQYFYLLVANTKTDTLYQIRFATDQRKWEKYWPVVERIFHQLYLDESV